MFNKNRAYEISDDGLILENGVHIISGVDVPIHSVSAPTIYFRNNREIYTNDGAGSGWILEGSGNIYQKYFIASGETYTIPLTYSSVVTGYFEIDNTGIVDVEGRLEII